ncbi:MAG: cytochrome d ubiquinol oxidase subunit II [Bacteroidales bacterium]|jgi:cytochrome d ubiquinol oxidase subunit II|nr:cytochrome d ubiquinol oxidase subunit II [Bacteroidales bacterium]
MFESLSYILLQQYWWMIISLLGSLLVFLLFVQGGQTMIYTLGKTDIERTMLVNSLGRKWEFTFTTLVTFGGAFFASFPLFYSTSFGGAYWVWMIILFAFILQAVSYEFRSKPNNFFGKRVFESFLFINGVIGTVFLGVAVATFFTGSEFIVDKTAITNVESPVISRWAGAARGLEAVLNFTNVALGLAVFFLARIIASLYFRNSIDNKAISERIKKQLLYNTVPFLIFFLWFLFALILKDGFAVNPDTKEVTMEPYKYLNNFLEMPIVLSVFLIGVVSVLYGIIKSYFKFDTFSNKGVWYVGIGTILTVFALFLLSGFNNTAYYPSVTDLQSSLTIENSSSSKFTLTAMSYVSLMVPFVAWYIWYAWKAINKKKIDQDEMETDSHVY